MLGNGNQPTNQPPTHMPTNPLITTREGSLSHLGVLQYNTFKAFVHMRKKKKAGNSLPFTGVADHATAKVGGVWV